MDSVRCLTEGSDVTGEMYSSLKKVFLNFTLYNMLSHHATFQFISLKLIYCHNNIDLCHIILYMTDFSCPKLTFAFC